MQPDRYVTGFMFSHDLHNVLLIRKQKPIKHKDLYNGIGGQVEFAESPGVAMVREFHEEAGVKTSQNQWEEYVRLICPMSREIWIFRAFSDEIYEARTQGNEELKIVPTKQVDGSGYVHNLGWLVRLAVDLGTQFDTPEIITLAS